MIVSYTQRAFLAEITEWPPNFEISQILASNDYIKHCNSIHKITISLRASKSSQNTGKSKFVEKLLSLEGAETCPVPWRGIPRIIEVYYFIDSLIHNFTHPNVA